MSHYPGPYSLIIRVKVKVVLVLSIYATKKELNDASVVDASNLALSS